MPAGAAASATGWGEAIAATVLCKEAVDRCARGFTVEEAVASVLELLRERIVNHEGEGATAGIILVDREGRGAWAYSTPAMARGFWAGGEPWTAVGA